MGEQRHALALQLREAGVEQDSVGQQPHDQPAPCDDGLDLVLEPVRSRVRLDLLLDSVELLVLAARGERGGGRSVSRVRDLRRRGDDVGDDGVRRLSVALRPVSMIAVPPSKTLPEKASRSESWSISYFDVLTDEIANRTTNSASSSVIMSA